MPTRTWERLPDTRRQAVLAAAEREFAARGFSHGSLNTIAREAGIAKGSLFQYFDDKADLYVHLSDRASARIRAEITVTVAAQPWGTDFFGALRTLNDAWVRYFFDHPVDLALTAAVNLEPDRVARPAVRATANRHYAEVLRPLIQIAADTDQLVADADLDAMLALLLLALPHIALAPHVSGLDPVLGMESTSPEVAVAAANRLLNILEAAYRRRD